MGDMDQQRVRHWRTDIEGLRTIAVGLVIAAHAGISRLEGGFIGVDVFFVISGFLITGLLMRQYQQKGRIDLRSFYARRATRLLPAAMTVLIGTLIASWIWLAPLRLRDIAADAVASALNVMNIRLSVVGTDYMNADAEPSPLQHFWSLAVEEQFYLVWPLLIVATAWIVHRLLRRATAHTVTRVVGTILIGVIAVSLALSALNTADNPVWSYYGIHTRAWELAAGALVALVIHRVRLNTTVAALIGWGGLVTIAYASLSFTESTTFPGLAALLPVLGTIAVIVSGTAPGEWGPQPFLELKPMQYVGSISYGLYLWHWPILLIGPIGLGIADSTRNNLVLMVGAFILAALSFHLIEDPIRKQRSLIQRPSRALAMGSGLATVTLAGAFVIVSQPIAGTEEVDDSAMSLEAAVEIEDVPEDLTPSIETAGEDKPDLYERSCLVGKKKSELNDDCWFGDSEGETTVVVFGDSHAAQWFPPLENIAQQNDWKLLVETKAGCSPAKIKERNKTLEREYHECTEWRSSALDHIDEIEPDMTVVSSTDDNEILEDDPDQAWLDGWEYTHDRLMSATDGNVVQMASTPTFSENIPTCLSENLDQATRCAFELDESGYDFDLREETLRQSEDMGVQVIDPLPWLCDVESRVCPAIVGDLLVYRDTNHMTAKYAESLETELAGALPFPKQWDADRS